jgi:uncharacterized membrane protein (UPF0127 family)
VKRLPALAFIALLTGCKTDSGAVLTPVTTTTNVVFPGGTLSAKIASTFAARDTGLMNVTSLGANSGMLFVFATDHTPSNCAFWIQNTPLPLSIAFIDANFRVINTDEMAAETTTFHMPTSSCRYAIEANQGWMTAHGVTAGTTVAFSLPAGTITDP